MEGQGLGLQEAADRLGVCWRTARRWCEKGRFGKFRKIVVGKRVSYQIDAEAVARVKREVAMAKRAKSRRSGGVAEGVRA